VVGVHFESFDVGGGAVGDRPWLIDATASRVDPVAGADRHPGWDRRCACPRRPHRLAPAQEPLRMAVARFRVGPRPSVAAQVIRRLRSGGAAWMAHGSPDGRPSAESGRADGASPSALPVAAVPHGPAAVTTLAFLGLDRGTLRYGPRFSQPFLRQPTESRGDDHRRDRDRGDSESGTHRYPGSQVTLQDDRNLFIYDPNNLLGGPLTPGLSSRPHAANPGADTFPEAIGRYAHHADIYQAETP
jgi:hypothetical protein